MSTTLGAVSLAASCPRCTSPVTETDAAFTCRKHGTIIPLWRPDVADGQRAALNLAVDRVPGDVRHTRGVGQA